MRINPVLLLLAPAWLLWFAPFVLAHRRGGSKVPQTVDRRARWGIALQGLSFALVWFRLFWIYRPSPVRVGIGIALLCAAILLSWTGARTLGRQWRVDAGLNVDHELVRTGPYRLVRHPIYSSMLALMLGTASLLSRPSVLFVATLVHIAGTEIRVRTEDHLLAARFGAAFETFRREVPAYLPFVR